MEYTFRLAEKGEAAAVQAFVRRHWGAPHPLVELPEFFEYYYREQDGGLRFGLALQGDAIVAAAGFVPSCGGPQPDVWVSLWVADPAARGAGLELMEALPRLCGCRTLSCNNIRPETRPFYTFLGFETGRVGHFYRLAPRRTYRLAFAKQPVIPPVGGSAALRLLGSPAALRQSGFVPPEDANPYKDLAYIEKRYFHFPRRRYLVYAAGMPGGGAPRALLVGYVTEALGSSALRLVDYIGPADFLPEMGDAMDRLLAETGAEYADIYCAGIPPETLYAAGFCERIEVDGVIVPNYLTPPLRQNVEYYYFTSRPQHFVLMRADGDQDRPHVPLGKNT